MPIITFVEYLGCGLNIKISRECQKNLLPFDIIYHVVIVFSNLLHLCCRSRKINATQKCKCVVVVKMLMLVIVIVQRVFNTE